MTSSSSKMHRYGMPQPIWQQTGRLTLTTSTKLSFILLSEGQQLFWSQPLWNTNDKIGFNPFLMFVTFQYRGLYHLGLHHTLIIEAWLKSYIHLDCRYLKLWNACIISLVFIVSNARDGTESKYPSIFFLSIVDAEFYILFGIHGNVDLTYLTCLLMI